MLTKLIDKVKNWYGKPFVKNAVDTTIIGFMESWLQPRGYMVAVAPNEQQEATVFNIKDLKNTVSD